MGRVPSRAALVGIVGPTASGKTDLALALARRFDAEILVADSRQVYRGMDIGTAKPDAAARRLVPHHLLDLVRPDELFTVADWVDRARRLIPQISGRGRLPMLVGGTGLYVEALTEGHDYASQPWSPEHRDALTAELEAHGLAPLAERLTRLDPAAAGRTDLRNPRRVLRALERVVAGSSGAPSATPYDGPIVLVGLSRPRTMLYARIDRRARWLFEVGGLVDEVRALREQGYGPELRPMTGHGYAEAGNVLDGRWGTEEAIEMTARRTRQYAKRQLSWFGRDRRIVWLPAGEREADDPSLVTHGERLVRAALS